MIFNTPYSTHEAQSPMYTTQHSYYFSVPYNAFSLPQRSDSYAVPGTTQVLDALTGGLETTLQHTPLDRFLDRRKRFAAGSVEDILGQIYERQTLKYDLIGNIEEERCYIKSKLLETGQWRTGLNPQLDKTRGQLQSTILALDQEKRREETACWRDITRLRSELREALREFDAEHHKTGLLNAPWKSENSAGN